MRLPNTLFARTSLTISGALLVFILFTGFVILNYMLLPVGRQSAGDLAALMVLSDKIWQQLPASAKDDFQQELISSHDLILKTSPPEGKLAPLQRHSPYMGFLEQELSARVGHTIHVHQTDKQSDWYWVLFPAAQNTLYIGFNHDHIGAEPPRVVTSIIIGASLFILLTTLMVVRRITRPLEALSQGVKLLGSSGSHQPLPENSPTELANLAAKFNKLSTEIQQLLDNRTTLLGSISHDLRTPLARLRLATELLEGEQNNRLIQNMQGDLEEMDALITRTLTLARMMQEDEIQIETIDLGGFLQEVCGQYEEQGKNIQLQLLSSCEFPVNRLILKRIISNLLDNACYYAGNKAIILQLECLENQVEICILDRGKGIPEDQINKVFLPFYRLDPSRNKSTGGSGLGLAIVQQLAQLQGWTIQLKNREDGGLSACVQMPKK